MIYLFVYLFTGFAVYFTYGIRNSKEGQEDDEVKRFLIKYSHSSENTSLPSSSTSSDDELLSSMVQTTDEDRSPTDQRRPKKGTNRLDLPGR